MAAKKKKFEDDLQRLENIVQELESGIAIEDALKLYEEGMTLSKTLEKKLKEIERKVYEVKNIETIEKTDDKLELDLFN